jgi:hypothetical protein
VRAFFKGTEYTRTIRHFFGPPFLAARGLPLLLGLIAGWNLPSHRVWLLVPVVCLGISIPMTLFYIYPINAVLFFQAGGNRSPEEIQSMARRWVIADRVWLGIMTIGFLSLLRALSIPFPTGR